MAEVGSNGYEPVAAVDLGSNSFHMIIGREVEGEVSVLDRLRDPVRLAAGLDEEGVLDEETLGRALASLERFGQRLHDIRPWRVRAIGTNAFRRATAPEDLLVRASDALGTSIEVLSGQEEARLIYLGVSHGQPDVEGRRLVVDIGGGSTECILGESFQPILLDSLYMGCVSYSLRYFPGGALTKKAFRHAELAAKLELEPLQRSFRETGWSTCVGSSGTINAIATVLHQAGWGDGSIELAGIKNLRKVLVTAESADRVELPSLQAERIPVLPGGLAILKAVFETFGIESMQVSKAALREGVLYDLLGRIRHEDVRDRTIRAFSQRYQVDEGHAARVERTALHCLEQAADSWSLDRRSGGQLLSWAARLHEIGLSVSYSGHHRHGAYLLANSTMPGFSRQDQERLAALVRGHRRKFSWHVLDDVSQDWRDPIGRLCILLRLAVRLNRTRSSTPLPEFELSAKDAGLRIRFPDGWLDEHPLTRADLEEEAKLLDDVGFALQSS